MKEIHVLRELEQIKAISHVYRIEVLDAFENKPKTAKQISEYMGEPHAKVNYHIKTLVNVGILELVEEVVKLGIVEKYYRPVAKLFTIDGSIMLNDKEFTDTMNKAAIALFERVSNDFYDSVENFKAGPPRKVYYAADYYMTDDEAKDLQNQVRDLIINYLEDKTEEREGALRYSLCNVLIPLNPEK